MTYSRYHRHYRRAPPPEYTTASYPAPYPRPLSYRPIYVPRPMYRPPFYRPGPSYGFPRLQRPGGIYGLQLRGLQMRPAGGRCYGRGC